MKKKGKEEEATVLKKPPALQQMSIESFYLSSLVTAESTILGHLQLPRSEKTETKAEESDTALV